MKRVIPDTNAWMAMAEFHLDLFQAVPAICDFPTKIYVLTSIIAELEVIKETQSGRFQRAATLALKLIQPLPHLTSSENVDQELIRLSHQGDVIITQDQALKKQLHKPYLAIRQKKKLILVQ